MQKIFERATWKEDWMVAKNAKWKQKMIFYTVSVLPFLLGGQLSVPNFEKWDINKMNTWEDLKSFCYRYFSGGISYVPCVKKDFVK